MAHVPGMRRPAPPARAERRGEPRPVPVTVSGTGPADDAPVASERSGGTLLLVLALLAGAVALAVGQRTAPPEPPPAAETSLRLVADGIAGSQTGVLVVPVEIDNRGPAVTVDDIVLWAGPVRQEASTNGVQRVGSASRARFVAILQPDCAVLQPAWGIEFSATVAVRMRGATGRRHEQVLDLGRDPAVVARIASLCLPAPG